MRNAILVVTVIAVLVGNAHAGVTVKGSKSNGDNFTTTVVGQAESDCPCPMEPCENPIHVFDCGGVDNPPTCYNDNDVELGSGPKAPNGGFLFDLPVLLKAGQVIYATDTCFSPPQVSPPFTVKSPTTAPLLARPVIGGLMALLALLGVVGVARLRQRMLRRA